MTANINIPSPGPLESDTHQFGANQSSQASQASQDAVQGEGDCKSAETYGKSVREFVQSGKVDDAAQRAKPATPQEQQELLEAEREGKSHSKGEDELVDRGHDTPPSQPSGRTKTDPS